jgi:GAF domain-containing protein/HAMP domain-containing protein
MTELKQTTSPQGETTRRAVLVGQSVIGNTFLFLALGIYLMVTTGSWQSIAFTAWLVLGEILTFFGTVAIRRGRMNLGGWLLLGGNMFGAIFASNLFVSLGYVAAVYILVTAYFTILYALPKEARRSGWTIAILALAFAIAVEVINPAWRQVSQLMLTVSPILTATLGIAFTAIIARQAWVNGYLRYRIIIILSAVLVPIMVASTWYNIQAQRNDLKNELINKAETVAIDGAATIGHLLEDAIANGSLTTQQVFDTKYQLYWKFDPSTYQFDGDPASLGKYHTAYDSYTDEHWQKLLDSYLNQSDFVFAVPVDENGYIPTHNTRWSSWDGSPATDRSKRIFNDPVGLNAARNTQPTLVQVYPRPGTGETLLDVSAPIYVNGEHWGAFRVGTVLVENNLFAKSSIQSTTMRSIVFSVVLVIIIIASSWFLGGYIARPLEKLTESASQLASGQFDEVVEASDITEVKTLATTFNGMASQLKDLFGSLEQRVAERTQILKLAADVGRAVSQVRALDVMLKGACELILKEFNLYYVQVYLTDPSGSTLRLEAGTGTVGEQLVGRGHSLPLDSGSVNGRAAVDKQTVLIPDTTPSATFRQNPLLPETRGEMAVPLIVGEQVVGVLDIQSSQPGVLTEEVLPAFEALAGQLAVAIQNANLLEEAEQARAEVEKQARRLVRTSWSEHLDAIHKPEQIGFVFDHNQVAPLDEVDASQFPGNGQAVSAPIAVSGEPLGSLVVELDEETRREQTTELVNIVARQVAQQLENLRLLESAERYRYEAEQAARRQARESWREYIGTKTGESLGYLYDLKEVRPYSNGHDAEVSVLTLPLKVRDEAVGKLAVQGLTPVDKDSLELVNVIAERLGAHIEGLRLTQQIQSRAQREQALRQITNAVRSSTDLTTILRTAVRELGTVTGRRAIIRMAMSDQSDGENQVLDKNESSENADGGMS